MNKTLLLDRNQFIVCDKGQKNILKSQYLEAYIKNSKQIKEKYEWKNTGVNAAFTQGHNLPGFDQGYIEQSAAINGASFIREDNKVIYSASIENQSALMIKDMNDDIIKEGHVNHGDKTLFFNLDYNNKSGETVISVSNESFERHLAILKKGESHFSIITEGETIEDNPSWDRGINSILYYDCAGIGKDHNGNYAGIGTRVINRLNMQTGDLDELVAVSNHDCFMPKTDQQGYLYFIQKPHKTKHFNILSIFSVFLIPFKIFHAVYRYIEFFTMKYTGQTFSTTGNNPAKTKPVDKKELFIHGNLIEAKKNEKKNRSKGEKFPGIAPRNWMLMKRDFEGNITSVKKGVIAFDINTDNEIIYSNGKYVVKINKDGKEEKIDEAEIIEKVIVI